MKILKLSSIITAFLVSLMCFVSCGRNGGTLSSISISPVHPTIVFGTHERFTATATFTNGTTIEWSSASLWSTSSSTIATVGNTLGTYGLVTSASCTIGCTTNTVTITATDTVNNISGSTTLYITVPQSIAISPENPYMASGKSHQFKATATLPDLSTGGSTTVTQDLTTYATWTTIVPEIATISNLGLITAGSSTGPTSIIATDPTLSSFNSTTLTVTDTPLASIIFMSDNPILSISTSTNLQFTAQGTLKNDSTSTPDLTSSVTWHSSNTDIATISNDAGSRGVATAIAVGTTHIKATDPITGVSKSVILEVIP